MHDLAVRTYAHRPYKMQNDWSNDPIQAARLGLADELKSTLARLIEKYQSYPSGLANFIGPEFYVEQIAVLAEAVQEALVQDYAGELSVAPAWPAEWDVDASVYIQNRSKVNVQMRRGVPMTVVIESGYSGAIFLRNPWAGQPVLVSDGAKQSLLNEGSDSLLKLQVQSGKSYSMRPSARDKPALLFAPVNGAPATKPKLLGTRSIGLAR